MQLEKVIRLLIKKKGYTLESAALKCNRTGSYFSAMLARHSAPRVDTMASICDTLGWDLIVRDREDGYEETIDPPIR